MQNLAEKLADRQLVIDYLTGVRQQAETNLGADDLNDDQWRECAHEFAVANANLIKAKTGRNWEPFLADAREWQETYGF